MSTQIKEKTITVIKRKRKNKKNVKKMTKKYIANNCHSKLNVHEVGCEHKEWTEEDLKGAHINMPRHKNKKCDCYPKSTPRISIKKINKLENMKRKGGNNG